MGACSMEDTLRKKYMKWIIWINLFFGIINLYYYVNNNSYFNLLIGALNIGVWVFNRNRLWRTDE